MIPSPRIHNLIILWTLLYSSSSNSYFLNPVLLNTSQKAPALLCTQTLAIPVSICLRCQENVSLNYNPTDFWPVSMPGVMLSIIVVLLEWVVSVIHLSIVQLITFLDKEAGRRTLLICWNSYDQRRCDCKSVGRKKWPQGVGCSWFGVDMKGSD